MVFLAIMCIILILCLRAFISLLHLFLDFLYCFTSSALLPVGPPSPSLMDFWSERMTKLSSELCDIYLRLWITYFLQSTQWCWVPWCLGEFLLGLLRRTPVLNFFLLGSLMDSSLSEWEDALADEIFLIWVDALFLLYLTSIVDRRSQQYSQINKKYSYWLSSNSSCMDEGSLYLI